MPNWVFAAGVVAGAVAAGAGAPADEAEAVAALRKLGGSVHDSDPRAGRRDDVVTFWDNPKLTDADLKTAAGHLRRLPGLRAVALDYTAVTDAGLAHLADLPGVEAVSLKVTRVTDAGLARLRALPALREVDLTLTGVTAEGVAAFAKARPGVKVTASGAGDPAGETAELRGRWRATPPAAGGKGRAAQGPTTLVVAGNDLAMFRNGLLVYVCRFAVDARADPKGLDCTITAVLPGFNSRSDRFQAIYRVEADALTLRLGSLDWPAERPRGFDGPADAVYRFTREKE